MRRFELSDETSSKFWEISTDTSSYTVRFGKLGTNGTTQTRLCASGANAELEAAKLIREKLRKGYNEVSSATSQYATPRSAPPHKASTSAAQDLSAFELGSIADFLTQAAQNYEDHSCNDYLVPASAPNRAVLAAAFNHGNEGLDDGAAEIIESNSVASDELFIWDSTLMAYLAHRAQMAQSGLAEGADSKPGARLTPAELDLTAGLLEDLATNEYDLYESVDGCEDFTLDATPQTQAYLAAVVGHAKRSGRKQKIQEIMASQDVVTAFSVDMLRWLALRCRGRVALPPPGATDTPNSSGASDQKPAPDTLSSLGVFKRWNNEKLIVKLATDMDDSWLPAYEKGDRDLVTYASGGNPFREHDDPDVPCTPPFARQVKNLLSNARQKHERNAILALFGRDASLTSDAELAKMVACDFRHYQVEALQFGKGDLRWMAHTLAECLYMGHMEQARLLARLLYQASAKIGHHWGDVPQLLRWTAFMAFIHWNLDDTQTPIYVDNLTEPQLIDLMHHWRDADLTTSMLPQLHWLCDFYTHEFGDERLLARLPVCILAWFRLREIDGLPIPKLDHPLMKPDYARLPAPRNIHTDATLDAVIARLRQEELAELGNLDLQTLPGRPQHQGPPAEEKSGWLAALKPRTIRHDPFNLLMVSVPGHWLDRSLPDVLRFRDPDTLTEFAFSAYRNPGLSYNEWADARLPAFASARPWLKRTQDRYAVNGIGWWGWAEEFDGVAPGTTTALHYLTLCFKNKLRLISLTVTGTAEAFAKDGELYRMLMRAVRMSEVDFEKNARSLREWTTSIDPNKLRHRELWPQRQDMPGLQRLATHSDRTDADKLVKLGASYLHGWGDTPEEEQANQDKAYAAEWFAYGAELSNTATQ